MINKGYLIFFLFFSIAGINQLNSFSSEINALGELDALTTRCIKTSLHSTCRRALVLAEVLQRNAAAQGYFSCQTRLLGLGADLLMISFDGNPKEFNLAMLKEVQTFCDNL